MGKTYLTINALKQLCDLYKYLQAGAKICGDKSSYLLTPGFNRRYEKIKNRYIKIYGQKSWDQGF